MPIASKTYIVAWVLTCALGALFINDAHAIRQYRCNGKVQYRPCDQVIVTKKSGRTIQTSIEPKARFAITGDRYAKVVKQQFTKDSPTQGLWKGVVKGNGFVELALEITRNGAVESSIYMGHLWLSNKESTFRFKSALPKGKGWNWHVKAWAS